MQLLLQYIRKTTFLKLPTFQMLQNLLYTKFGLNWIPIPGMFQLYQRTNILKVRTLYEHRNISSGFKTLLVMIPENQ